MTRIISETGGSIFVFNKSRSRVEFFLRRKRNVAEIQKIIFQSSSDLGPMTKNLVGQWENKVTPKIGKNIEI